MDILLAAALVLSVIGIKIAPKNTLWSADGLSMDDSNSLRGMLSVFIVLHHLAILTGAGYSAYFVKRIGHLIVAAFLAMFFLDASPIIVILISAIVGVIAKRLLDKASAKKEVK